MTTHEKSLIATELKTQAKLTSQNKLASKLGISNATVSMMVNNKWDSIDDAMWNKAKVNLKLDLNWVVVETSNYQTLFKALQVVQSRNLSIGISENAGIGKSEVYKQYTRTYKNVIHVECKNYWSKKSYVKNLLTTVGIDPVGTTEELIHQFLDHVKGLKKPLIIIDQADKLKDPQLDLFMDFYNDLFGHCGFILSGVKSLKKRIIKGVQRDKMGYRELWSRIGSKFYDQIGATTVQDVAKICMANGVEDGETIMEISNLSEGDLRKVRREVEKYQLMQTA